MKIGITIGDINGIGPEVIIKALSHPRTLQQFTPVIYASYKVMAYHKDLIKECTVQFHSIDSAKSAVAGKINIVTCWTEEAPINLGKPTAEGGKYATLSLNKAMEEVKANHIQAIVTAPIHKFAMQSAKFEFPGHTEYFTHHDNAKESVMLMVSDNLRVGLATNHIPIGKVASTLSKEIIMQKLQILNKALIYDFGIDRPVISIMGLNPHASDEGVIGDEEARVIKPAIMEAKKQGLFVTGPHPADGFFGNGAWQKTNAVLAMYHDQGLVPFKSLAFGGGTNVTCGLSFVRTSPDHGSAFDIAGQDKADATSMRLALYTALDIYRNRTEYRESRANALVRREKTSAGIHE
jgi:4-phospho-D-threonate 3-dehydrogenase / 4-phospho-D-erythronate 3-dehydrogenase